MTTIDNLVEGSAGIAFTLNGRVVATDAPPGARLSEVLRERLDSRDVKVGCNAGDCGACTVLLDGAPVCACTTAVAKVEGATVETVAGLMQSDPLSNRLTGSFQRHGAAQCGICTPGMIVAAIALLREAPAPTATETEDALGGVLCRCTGYRKIVDAVVEAGKLEDGPGSGPGQMNPSAPAAEPGPSAIGLPIPRVDGLAKIRGSELYGDDAAPADALVLRVVRSPHPHAGFAFGDLEAWRIANGVELILTAEDVPGLNAFGVIPGFVDQPVFAEGAARFRGEAVAAVIGEAAIVDRLNLDGFPVTWESRPHALTSDKAQAVPPLHETREGNVMCGGFVQCGDAEAALGRADAVAEGRFETAFVEHAYIEPEAGFARRVGDRLEIHACTQAPYMDRDSLAEIMGLAPEAVRIVPTATGGGFGAKLDLAMQPYVALAAWRLNRPVRLCYTRAESMQSTTKRHPASMTARIGATRDGTLCGFDFQGDFNTGAYASWGPTVATRVPIHASGPYAVADYRAESRGIHTHCPPSGAFRGFGVPQAAVAQECLFDELADAIGMDRLAFRRRNALTNGVPTVCGQVFGQGVGIGACFEALEPHWERARGEAAAFNAEAAPHPNPPPVSSKRGMKRRGVGIAAGWYGCGNTSLPNPSTIKAGITPEGRLVLHQGAQDIGQGANTVIAQIFAEALGVPVGALTLVGGDTDATPDAGKTSASRQTYVSCNAARLAGEALRATILRMGNVSDRARIGIGKGAVTLDDGGEKRRIDLAALAPDSEGYVLRTEETYDPPTKPLDENGQGAPYAVFGYAAHMVELEVDVALGTVRLLKFTAAHDVGKAINPMLVEGQVQGGIAQGIGMALMEEFLPGRTENLHDYLIPTFGDVPPVETLIVEETDAHGPYGAKGLGEHVLIPTAPAILNAIRDATGARIRKLPATPDRVRAALKEAGWK